MPDAKRSKLEGLRSSCMSCTSCPLHRGRKQSVFGSGSLRSEIMFIGEAPGADEDRKGKPFVGKAGKLLDNMIAAMGLSRDQVFVSNVVKCRPPGNRMPTEFEVGACMPRYLDEEIRTLKPRVIVALGATAAKALIRTNEGIGRLRGRFHKVEYIDIMPTFHPAYLLRKPEEKAKAWHDLKMVMDRLDLGGLT